MATIKTFETVAGEENSVRKTTVETDVTTVIELDVAFLIEQRTRIIRQRDEQVSARNRELADVEELLREAAKLEIPAAVEWEKENPVEEPIAEGIIEG